VRELSCRSCALSLQANRDPASRVPALERGIVTQVRGGFAQAGDNWEMRRISKARKPYGNQGQSVACFGRKGLQFLTSARMNRYGVLMRI
jgi:hypothetical protein